MATTNHQIISEIRKYIQFLNTQIEIEKIILFGSYAKGTATAESDIDIAIISSQFGSSPLQEKMKLFEWQHDADIDVRFDIRPEPIGLAEYEAGSNFFFEEIKKTGIDITKKVS